MSEVYYFAMNMMPLLKGQDTLAPQAQNSPSTDKMSKTELLWSEIMTVRWCTCWHPSVFTHIWTWLL